MDWMQALILLGTFEGFLLLSALVAKNLGRKNLNPYFFGLVGALSGALLAKLLFSSSNYERVPHFWYVLDLAAYVIGPLWYLTIKKSLKLDRLMDRWDWLLLAPTLQYIAFVAYLFVTYDAEQLVSVSRGDWPLMEWTFNIFCISVTFVNGAFLWRSYRLIQGQKGLPALFIDGQKLFLSVLVIWMLVFITGMFVTGSDLDGIFIIYDLGFVSLALIVFGWGYLALLKPAYFYFLTQSFSSSDGFVLEEIARRAQDEIATHRLYLDKDLTLRTLSERVQANPVMTSKAINRVLGMSFSDLINQYRVHHFVELARSERTRQLTHWALAQEAGFGNKVSFYKYFKKMAGVTPKKFLESGMEI